jgi:hypothetical protein
MAELAQIRDRLPADQSAAADDDNLQSGRSVIVAGDVLVHEGKSWTMLNFRVAGDWR